MARSYSFLSWKALPRLLKAIAMFLLVSRPDWITVVQPLICRSGEALSSLTHHFQACDSSASDGPQQAAAIAKAAAMMPARVRMSPAPTHPSWQNYSTTGGGGETTPAVVHGAKPRAAQTVAYLQQDAAICVSATGRSAPDGPGLRRGKRSNTLK